MHFAKVESCSTTMNKRHEHNACHIRCVIAKDHLHTTCSRRDYTCVLKSTTSLIRYWASHCEDYSPIHFFDVLSAIHDRRIHSLVADIVHVWSWKGRLCLTDWWCPSPNATWPLTRPFRLIKAVGGTCLCLCTLMILWWSVHVSSQKKVIVSSLSSSSCPVVKYQQDLWK